MQLKATRNVLVAGEHYAAGDPITTDEATGQKLLALGKAVKADEAPAPAKTKKAASK